MQNQPIYTYVARRAEIWGSVPAVEGSRCCPRKEFPPQRRGATPALVDMHPVERAAASVCSGIAQESDQRLRHQTALSITRYYQSQLPVRSACRRAHQHKIDARLPVYFVRPCTEGPCSGPLTTAWVREQRSRCAPSQVQQSTPARKRACRSRSSGISICRSN